jgi:hypothetical protein
LAVRCARDDRDADYNKNRFLMMTAPRFPHFFMIGGPPVRSKRHLLQISRRGARVAGSVTKRELMRIVKKRTVDPFEITNVSETSALMARLCIRLGC